jgi:ORF6N domain
MNVKMDKSVIPSESIVNKIYVFRGQKVMLDSDLAELYRVETKRLNEQVKRNIGRFPKSFMFQLTREEWLNLKSQNATSRWGGRRKEPFVFTEHGILMLSSVLNSDIAIKMSVQIIETFVQLRKIANNYEEIMSKIKQMESQYNNQFGEIYEALQQLLSKKEEKPRQKIGYKKNRK